MLITFDRYFLVAYPNRFNFIKTKKFVCIIYTVLIIVLGFFNIPNLLYTLNVTTSNTTTVVNGTRFTTTVTTSSCSALRHVSLMRDMGGIFLRTIIPLTLIICGNGLLIRAFIASKMRVFNSSLKSGSHSTINPDLRSKSESANKTISLANEANSTPVTKPNGSSKSSSYQNSKRDANFMRSIIAMDTVYIFMTIPLAVTVIMNEVYNSIPTFVTSGNYAAHRLAYLLCIYVALLSLTFPFLISLLFNKIVRKEFFSLLNEIKSKLV